MPAYLNQLQFVISGVYGKSTDFFEQSSCKKNLLSWLVTRAQLMRLFWADSDDFHCMRPTDSFCAAHERFLYALYCTKP